MQGTLGRRAFAAFRLGFAISAAGAAVIGGLALARGPDMNLPIFGAAAGSASAPAWPPAAAPSSPAAAPRPRHMRSADDEERPVRRVRQTHSHYLRYGNAVCVRLCDGSFFPAAEPAGGDAACGAQCPDAPVALYSMPGDDIAAAVSLTGAPYSALPVAERHTKTFDNTCTCHRSNAVADETAWRKDRTLRKGDVVATQRGFVVYAGARSDGAGDFVALSRAGLGRERLADLAAMERVSTPPVRRGAVTVSDARTP